MSRYKGRSGFNAIARHYPYVVNQFHRHRGIKDQRGPRRRDDEHDYLRWCFADLGNAEAFAAEFSGKLRLP
jgi:hypothetical protein